MTISQFQDLIRRTYHARDAGRGTPSTFMWLVEELGELARALQTQDAEALEEEFADVLAWVTTLASLADVDLERVAESRYGSGCPKCGAVPCRCARGHLPQDQL